MRPPGESLWRRHWRHQRTGPGEYFLRSEEHTSELQSRLHLVCRLLLEKNKSSDYNRGIPNMHLTLFSTSARPSVCYRHRSPGASVEAHCSYVIYSTRPSSLHFAGM